LRLVSIGDVCDVIDVHCVEDALVRLREIDGIKVAGLIGLFEECTVSTGGRIYGKKGATSDRKCLLVHAIHSLPKVFPGHQWGHEWARSRLTAWNHW
jgi:hypothetical protein